MRARDGVLWFAPRAAPVRSSAARSAAVAAAMPALQPGSQLPVLCAPVWPANRSAPRALAASLR